MSDFQNFLDENLAQIDIQFSEDDNNEIYEYDVYKEIRELVINLRDELGITQKQLAKMSGLTQANISNIEKGISRPTIDSLKRIADAVGKRLVVEFGERS